MSILSNENTGNLFHFLGEWVKAHNCLNGNKYEMENIKSSVLGWWLWCHLDDSKV